MTFITTIFYAYLASVGISYLSINALSIYFRYRLKKEGYKYERENFGEFLHNQIGYLYDAMIPIVNLKVPHDIIFDREKAYSILLNDCLSEDIVYKPEVKEEKQKKEEKQLEYDRLKIEKIISKVVSGEGTTLDEITDAYTPIENDSIDEDMKGKCR